MGSEIDESAELVMTLAGAVLAREEENKVLRARLDHRDALVRTLVGSLRCATAERATSNADRAALISLVCILYDAVEP